MRKKILAILLVIVMVLGVFAGCSLVSLDEDAVNGQVVSEIKPHTFVFTGDDGTQHEWVSPHVKVTRYELNTYYNNNYSNYISSMSRGEIMKMFNTVLFNQRMLGVYAQLNIEKAKYDSDVKMKDLTKKQVNDAWRTIYDSLETRLYSEMKSIADAYGETAPTQPTKDASAEETTTYPVYKEPNQEEDEDAIEDFDWSPATIVIGEDGLTSAQKMELQAGRNLFASLIKDAEGLQFQMSKAEREELVKDRNAYDELKNLPLTDERVVNAYASLRDRFCTQYLYYKDTETSLKISNIQTMVESAVSTTVSTQDLSDRLTTALTTQLANYSTESEYINALSSPSEPLLVHPYDVGYFYVKHILVPFSDAQKEQFVSTSTNKETQGLSDAQLKERRKDQVELITSYEHRDGEDYGNPLSLAQIRQDIKTTMAQAGTDSYARDKAFTKLIYKYNTDTGAFDNEWGYGLQRNETSSYMPEFEKSAKGLYDAWEDSALQVNDRDFGGVVECVTDYGVHFMILSSVLPKDKETTVEAYKARISLNDYYTVSQSKTIGKYMTEKIVEERKTNAWSSYQNLLMNRLLQEFGSAVVKNDSIVDELIEAE